MASEGDLVVESRLGLQVTEARFEAHLAGCPHCTEYLREMRVTIAALGRVESESVSRAARDNLIALYRNWRAS